jgi:phytoene dehydrogenase-like protein
LTPLDACNAKNYCPEGNWAIIDPIPSQNGAFRPILELSQYRTPTKGLYCTGSGWHPGAGGMYGAGPNGLAAGAYLSRAGLKVLILEKRYESGGGLATEEVTFPYFFHSTHSVYHMMVDFAPPYHDFEMAENYDVRYVWPDLQFVLPLSDGRAVCLYKDEARTCESFAQFSKKVQRPIAASNVSLTSI